MNRLPVVAVAVALLAALGAILYVLLADGRPPTLDVGPPIVRPDRSIGTEGLRHEPVRGGVYAGRVLDQRGEPLPGATVLLVAFDSGEDLAERAPVAEEGTPPDLSALPVLGHRTAAELKTDDAGRFRVTADSRSAVRMVAAYLRGYMPGMAAVRGPTEDLVVRLQDAGEVIGTVLDGATGRPVQGAEVTVYLQQKASPVPETGARGFRPPPGEAVSPFAAAQKWVAREFGVRVWGVKPRGDEGLHFLTDGQGRFRFGPIGNEVQLEFVITHARYAWTEFDRNEAGVTRRLVVQPGETVERTFRLEPGRSIAGRVVDEVTERGVPDVLVEVDHVVQRMQHWWYRMHKRRARTGRDGSFEVHGLSHGPYNVILRHPAFGEEVINAVQEDARDLVWRVESLGGLHGRIVGLDASSIGDQAHLFLEARDERGGERHEQKPATVSASGDFAVYGIKPGAWEAWVRVGARSSLPQRVVVTSQGTTPVDFVLGGGGSVRLRLLDGSGRPLDPVGVRLVRLGESEAGERVMGRHESRGGWLEVEGVVPGRYRAEASAPGYASATSAPFDVPKEGWVEPAPLTLLRMSYLDVRSLEGPDGRSPGVDVELTLQEGDAPARRLFLTGREVLVRPGPVTVRARAVSGPALSFEDTLLVPEGETVAVRIRLR